MFCAIINCVIIGTTDVQTATILHFENNIFVTCTFASNSDASGCSVQLMLVSGTEFFSLTRPGSSVSVSSCSQTRNQLSAYINRTARDIEADGSMGTGVILLQPSDIIEIDDVNSYTGQTGCSVPVPGTTLGAGAIAGIVIAVLIIGVVVLGVIVIVVVYRIRTGQWFKLREKDDEGITVHFEKELLMGDMKPKKKSKFTVCN